MYGAERVQPAAIAGREADRRNGSDKPNPLPSTAIGCAHNDMVKKGSMSLSAAQPRDYASASHTTPYKRALLSI